MPKMCAICQKRPVISRQISHAHNVTPRAWKPNLHRVRALIGGGVRRIWVCTRCLRSGRVAKPPARDWSPQQEETAGGS